MSNSNSKLKLKRAETFRNTLSIGFKPLRGAPSLFIMGTCLASKTGSDQSLNISVSKAALHRKLLFYPLLL